VHLVHVELAGDRPGQPDLRSQVREPLLQLTVRFGVRLVMTTSTRTRTTASSISIR